MRELFITRHNDLVDPSLHVWAWQIPVYLFLGGLVAGMMIIVGIFLYKRHDLEERCVCGFLPTVALVLLSLGMGALFLDLEHKLYVWRLYLTFQLSSPMSWGAWILVLVYPVLLLDIAVKPPELLRGLWPSLDRFTKWLGEGHRVQTVAVLNVAVGVGLGIYTGILLSSLGARPFWSSALLGPLFLTSGLSSAAAFTHMVARHVEERELLAKNDNVYLAIELVLLGLFLVGLLSASQAHVQAAHLVLGGPFTAVFWVFVVGLGIVVPLIIQILATSHRIPHTPIGPLLVLAGGLALRFIFVLAGQYSHWPTL